MKKYLLTGIKYLFSILLILLTFRTTKQFWYVGMSVLELAILFLVSNALISKNKYFCILNDVFMLIFNAETLVLLFGNKYISYLMLDNLSSLEDLSGRALEYVAGIIMVLVFSFLPCKPIERIQPYFMIGICSATMLEAVLLANTSQAYSPSRGIYELFDQYRDYHEMNAMIEAIASGNYDVEQTDSSLLDVDSDIEVEADMTFFDAQSGSSNQDNHVKNQNDPSNLNDYETENTSLSQNADDDNNELSVQTDDDSEIDSKNESQEKDRNNSSPQSEKEEEDSMEEKTQQASETGNQDSSQNIAHDIFGSSTNVILIFTEGLSKCVITDERGIMPNVSNFAARSLSFKNYYNHTFATYRGIQGQLYSGFQNDNLDTNHLTSMMDIMKQNGYYTAMINTEPNNSDFTGYLKAMSFDEIYSDPNRTSGSAYSMNDREAYAFLYEKASELKNSGKKFCLVIYTFGTHTTLDGPEQPYGDGLSPELNKFHNADYYFGEFFNKFCESGLASNTTIVYTTDHATYTDEAWTQAFPDVKRGFSDLSEIPLYIYYQGRNGNYDAKGRNSLDLAPTVLDLLGLPSSEDFLGSSLFATRASSGLDTYFWEPGALLYTGNDKIESISAEKQKRIYALIAQYLARK